MNYRHNVSVIVNFLLSRKLLLEDVSRANTEDNSWEIQLLLKNKATPIVSTVQEPIPKNSMNYSKARVK